MSFNSRHIARSALWNHLGKVGEYALLYVISVLIARSLGLQENGRYAGVLSLVQLLLVFGSFGIETALNTFLPRLEESHAAEETRFLVRRAVILRLFLLGALLFPIAGVLALFRGESYPLFAYLWMILALAAVRGVASILSITLVARVRTDITAIVNVGARSAELIAFLLLARGRADVASVLLILISGAGLQITGYLLAARSSWFGRSQHVALRPIAVFGGIFWLNTAVDYFLGRQGDVFFLSLLLPDSGQASLYDVAYSLMQAGTMVMSVGLTGVSLAAFANLAAQTPDRLARFYEFLVRIVSALTIPVMVFLAVESDAIVPLIYTHVYAGVVPVLQILLLGRIVSRLFGWGENAEFLLALNRPGEVMALGGLGVGVTIALHLILIPRYGATGAAFGAGAGALTTNIAQFFRVRVLSGTRIQMRNWFFLLLPALLSAGIARMLPSVGSAGWDALLSAALFTVLFGLTCLIIRPVPPEDVRRLVRSLTGSASPVPQVPPASGPNRRRSP